MRRVEIDLHVAGDAVSGVPEWGPGPTSLVRGRWSRLHAVGGCRRAADTRARVLAALVVRWSAAVAVAVPAMVRCLLLAAWSICWRRCVAER